MSIVLFYWFSSLLGSSSFYLLEANQANASKGRQIKLNLIMNLILIMIMILYLLLLKLCLRRRTKQRRCAAEKKKLV